MCLSFPQPLTCVDGHGPARAFAELMAEMYELDVKKLGYLSRSLGSYVGVGL